MLRKVFVVVHGWILMVPCNSLTLTTLGREIRHCSEVSLLAVSGMVRCLKRLMDSVCLAGSVGVLTVMVTFLGSALFHLSLRFVNTLSFMISWRWTSRVGLGVCFGTVGYLFFLGLMGDPLGLRTLERVLVIFLSVLLGGTLLRRLRSGSCLLDLMLRVPSGGWLLSLMSGLMEAW